ASTSTALLSVGLVNTTTTASVAAAPFGASSVMLSATLVVNYPAVGQVNQGTVSFVVTGPSSTQVCSTGSATVLPNADGTTSSASATCTIANGTPVGTYTISPTYSGGANFNPSTAPPSSAVSAVLSIVARTTTLTATCAPTTLNAGAT